MPIIVGGIVEPPPAEPPPPVDLPGVGKASAIYYDPTGGVWPLTDYDRGWHTLPQVSGLGAVVYEHTIDPQPRGGGRLRHSQPQVRDVIWPLHVQGSDHMEFVERWRTLARAFTRTLHAGEGPGILEIARPDGTRRRLRVRYREGWEGQADQGYGRLADNAVVTLLAEDPYWYDPVSISVHREHAVGSPFLNPFPTISSGQVLGATTVTNPGDVIVWPEWVITGPASGVTFTHSGTGETFTLDPDAAPISHGNLLTGEQVTVRTDPIQVRYQDGTNWTPTLNWPSAQLWGLQPGDNAVTFALSGSGPGSAVDLQYNPRYETA